MFSIGLLKCRWSLAFGFAGALAAFCSSNYKPAYAQAVNDPNFHISAIAEFYADHVYSKKPGHKALSVGPGGYWADTTGQSTANKAKTGALYACNKVLRTAPFKSLSKQQCVIFDIDGKRTGAASPIGVPFGTVLDGPDFPLLTAFKLLPKAKARGTVLFIHGCNQPRDIGGWMHSWASFYQAAGYRFFAPNSFADVREPALCGSPGEKGIDQQTRILKLRIAQTRRSLASLREQFPDDPIYVHGQSEGGYVVPGARGESCGYHCHGQSMWCGSSAGLCHCFERTHLGRRGNQGPILPASANSE